MPFSPTKYVQTAERGLVILSVDRGDRGLWHLKYEERDISLILCTYNVTVDVQQCSTPTQTSEFQKVYADWCHEFHKYKQAMDDWQRKQEVIVISNNILHM
jgi:hypothetical protein